jgi:hypothetical protein
MSNAPQEARRQKRERQGQKRHHKVPSSSKPSTAGKVFEEHDGEGDNAGDARGNGTVLGGDGTELEDNQLLREKKIRKQNVTLDMYRAFDGSALMAIGKINVLSPIIVSADRVGGQGCCCRSTFSKCSTSRHRHIG